MKMQPALPSDVELAKIRRNVRMRGDRRTVQHRKNVAHSLNGLACACDRARKFAPNLRGYRVARIGKSSGLGDAAPTEIALIPISDKSAVANAVKMFAAARRTAAQGTGMNGFGNTQQASGAASGAAAGAKVGSIVPGIGTIIGAVVGAIVGWLAAKPKPVRATAAQVAQCKSMLTEYMSIASQSPNAPLPMEWTQLLDMNWCYQAIYGAEIKLKDPRWFNPGFESGLRVMAIEIVKKIYETPVGGTVNLDAVSFKDPKGRKIAFGSYSFVNPVFTDLKTFSANYFEKIDLAFCQATASGGSGGCAAQRAHPEWKRLLYDLLAWAARTTLPNISEADFAAASQVAATMPDTSAKNVVSAVEQIINRPVARGETAALLTSRTDVPGVVAPVPVVPVPPSTAPPLPGVSTQAATDVTALISQLIAQGQQTAQVTQSALDALRSSGAPITPAVTNAVGKEIVAQQAGGFSTGSLLTVGGVLAGLFLFSRPVRRAARK